MSRQKTKTDDIRREHYLQERGGEQTLYVTEYMQRRSYLLE